MPTTIETKEPIALDIETTVYKELSDGRVYVTKQFLVDCQMKSVETTDEDLKLINSQFAQVPLRQEDIYTSKVRLPIMISIGITKDSLLSYSKNPHANSRWKKFRF